MKYIIIVNTFGIAEKYGVGRYCENLFNNLESNNNFKIVHLKFHELNRSFNYEIKNDKIAISIPRNPNQHNFFEKKIFSLKVITCLESLNINIEKSLFLLNNSQIDFAKIIKRYKSRFIYTVHYGLWDFDIPDNFTEFNKAINAKNSFGSILKNEKFMCLNASKVICLSRTCKSYVENYYEVNKNKVDVIYSVNSNDIIYKDKKDLKKRYGLPSNRKFIIYAGRLTKEKGIDLLMKSFSDLIKQGHKIQLLLVGDGPNLPNYFYDNLKEICGYVTYTGYVDFNTLSDFIQMSEIGILPSFKEQNSLGVIEMLSHGLPMIVSDIPGFADNYEHLKNIIKFDIKRPDNINELTNAILLLLKSPAIRRKIARNAKKLILEIFHQNVHNQKYYALFNEILSIQSTKVND